MSAEFAYKNDVAIEIDLSKGKQNTTTRQKVENTFTSELIFGICSPIGSKKIPVIEEIKKMLENTYNYDVQVIKMSEYINKFSSIKEELIGGETIAYTTIMNKIKGGNELRKKYNNLFLSELAIYDIYIDRMGHGVKLKAAEDLTSRRKCFIIDSLKNKEELNLLRSLYRDIFYQFSVFSPKDERLDNLLNQNMSADECKKLIDTDEYENNNDGQNVRDCFIEGDFFVRVSDKSTVSLSDKIARYLHLIFESQIITPQANEIAMYEAKSAAGNSACLSRQVGAAITNEKGEIISRGWNDVPKYGGNLYKDGEEGDNRCIVTGHCSNDTTKNELSENILKMILDDEYLKPIIEESKQRDSIYSRLNTQIRKSTKIKDLIEFSRSVHAEMHAIIMGSQLAGSKMVGGKLFCTTYPCHNCGRHIIVAGIKEIYYIEPYVKSLCVSLHKDAITENESDNTKVRILMYDGVAPRRYLDFFTMKSDRKIKDGSVIKKDFHSITPKSMISLQSLPILEAQAIHNLKDAGVIELNSDQKSDEE